MNRATSPTGSARNPDGSPGYTWNPLSGCLNHDNGLCKGGNFPCYAYKLANGRLKPLYLANRNIAMQPIGQNGALGYRYDYDDFKDPFYPRFWEERLAEIQRGIDDHDYQRYIRQKPRGIFVSDMSDLFGVGIPEEWTAKVLEAITEDCNSMHRFYLLTKQPQNLIKFSPFPDNAWIGVTATNQDSYWNGVCKLERIKAKVKYISFEPLLSEIKIWHTTSGRFNELQLAHINWLIIGACTGTWQDFRHRAERYPDLPVMRYGKKWTLQPKIEWVREIVETAIKAGIFVFLKDNLRPLLAPEYETKYSWAYHWGHLRQELPE